MSLYLARIDAIMEAHECDYGEAVEIMKFEFAHDELPAEDEVDVMLRVNEDDYDECQRLE